MTMLAGIGARALARIFDFVLVWVLLFWAGTFYLNAQTPGDPRFPVLWAWFCSAVSVVYEVVPTALWGRTLGKLLWRIRVTGTDGEGVGWLRSIKRWAVPSIFVFAWSFVPGAIGTWTSPLILVVYLWAVIDPDRQGLHDKVAGTRVEVVPRPSGSTREPSAVG